MSFLQNRESVCDFMIMCSGNLAVVRVRKARCIRGTREEIEKEFQEPIKGLRSFPSSGLIFKELRTYSRYGIWRFFHIEDTGIVEICQDGMPLKNPFIVVARTVRAVYPRKTGAALIKE